MVMSQEQPYAEFDRFQFQMPKECVEACSHSGSCDADVEQWEGILDLTSIDPNDIREELVEYGAWDEENLKDDRHNRLRIIWIGAGNISDEFAQDGE